METTTLPTQAMLCWWLKNVQYLPARRWEGFAAEGAMFLLETEHFCLDVCTGHQLLL